MKSFIPIIERIFDCNLSTDIFEIVAAAKNSKFDELSRAYEEYVNKEESIADKPINDVRPYYPNYLSHWKDFTYGGLGISDFSTIQGVWSSINALKHRLLYCHSIAIDDPGGPIIELFKIYYSNENLQSNFEQLKNNFLNYLNFLVIIKPLLDKDIVVFVPFKYSRLIKIGLVQGANLRFNVDTSKLDFSDVKTAFKTEEMQEFIDSLHGPSLVLIAEEYINRILSMSLLVNNQIDYYFAYKFWCELLKSILEEQKSKPDLIQPSFYQTEMLNCLTRVNLPKIGDLDPKDIVSIRLNDDTFNNWRASLSDGLRNVSNHGTTKPGWQKDIEIILKESTTRAKDQIEKEMNESSFLNSLKVGRQSFTLGVLNAVAVAQVTGSPLAGLAALGIKTVTETSVKAIENMNKREKLNPVFQHYISIS